MKILLVVLILASVSQAFSADPIDEKSFINLGGEEQYVEIKGADSTNPVLLILHGGPGWPQTPSLRAFNSDISKRYTMVIWEQRGAGLSYMKNPNPTGMSLEQFISDADQLVDILRKKFNKEKIYLAGYSWGSAIGLNYAKRHPSKLHAYIGVAQIVNMKRGMKYSQKWARKKAEAAGDKESLELLDKLRKPSKDFCDTQHACFMKQYEVISKYNGHIFDTEINEKIITRTAGYKDYAAYDWMKPFFFSAHKLLGDLEKFDAKRVKRLKIPAYFFLGRHDHNVPAVLAAEYVSKLKAPKKVIIWMEKSGHALMEEEAEKFNRLIVDEVLGKASM